MYSGRKTQDTFQGVIESAEKRAGEIIFSAETKNEERKTRGTNMEMLHLVALIDKLIKAHYWP